MKSSWSSKPESTACRTDWTDLWQFWIDVGGTFTDCMARRPDGRLLRHKLLSSGVTKGRAGPGSSAERIVDPARCGDPPGFWVGYRLRLLDQAGRPAAETRVVRFQRSEGYLEVAPPLAAHGAAGVAGSSYELVSDEEAPVVGIRYLMGLRRDEPVPAALVRLGTTRGTNALITRRGARTALVTTRGFGDMLRIGYQDRPHLFALAVIKPEPLFERAVEVAERVTADGQVLQAPDPEAVRAALVAAREAGIESLAVCLLHAYARPDHEELVARVAAEVGFQEVSLSSRVAPVVKVVARGDTTVVDAYLNPVLRAYIDRLRAALGRGRLQILSSAGGLVEADRFVGKDSILSGPAGGVVGFAHAARACGFERAIGFDMGGTSTDVSRFDGRHELEYETEKAGVRVVAPMLAIETVAGGGSICRFDGVKLGVGPDSAGAEPGPACYGRGGPLALTDLNFYLGKIPADRFPFPLDRQAVHQRLVAMARQIREATGTTYTPHALADGFLQVANANMVKAIRSVSVAKGADPRTYVLVAFGGAAPQHACAVARELGIRQVLVHPDAGILSACGIGQADVVRHRVAGVYRDYSDAAVEALGRLFNRLAQEARDDVLAEGVPPERIRVHRSLDLRYQGLDAWLTVPEPAAGTYAEAYHAAYRSRYGYTHPERPLEIVAARIEVVGHSEATLPEPGEVRWRVPSPVRTMRTWLGGNERETAVYDREQLQPGDRFDGPAVVCEPRSTTVVDPGWQAAMLPRGELLLTDRVGVIRPHVSTRADPVMLEIFNNRFAGIAEQMGITLRNTACSVNVKERLDFSCALFTPTGDLVVNAPHIPVHLGAMGETVRTILSESGTIRPGDVFLTNDPYRGGAHLPDVTVVTPVHDAEGRLLFFAANRAHHAEIGGITPGSMPPFSKSLAEEGVLIPMMKVVDAGRPQLETLRRLLDDGPYPSRAVEDNLADITAQIAANRQGVRDLRELVSHYSLPVVQAYMGHIQEAAERKMRTALGRLPNGRYQFADAMDDGSPIAVTVTVDGEEATIDFTGCGPVVPANLNANRAIVTAAVMYVLRLLIDEDIPLNQGVLAPVQLVLPEGILNPPRRDRPEDCAAVVGGNVETSQRVVDCLLGALGAAAASQGTMNNVLFGDRTFGYYETICGGAGSTAQHDGADAVHTHMTNTRLTDPEVLEQRYPVRVLEFSIRRGSGGPGTRRGGDGVIRRIAFLRDLDLSVLSQRRGPYPPFGLAGGGPGSLGQNTLRRADGTREDLGGCARTRVRAGDQLVIRTPGGGGFGSAPIRPNPPGTTTPQGKRGRNP